MILPSSTPVRSPNRALRIAPHSMLLSAFSWAAMNRRTTSHHPLLVRPTRVPGRTWAGDRGVGWKGDGIWLSLFPTERSRAAVSPRARHIRDEFGHRAPAHRELPPESRSAARGHCTRVSVTMRARVAEEGARKAARTSMLVSGNELREGPGGTMKRSWTLRELRVPQKQEDRQPSKAAKTGV